jgi:hypothetical protein
MLARDLEATLPDAHGPKLTIAPIHTKHGEAF